jgi:hypothetical protein
MLSREPVEMAASVSGVKNMYPAEALMVETVAEAAILLSAQILIYLH